MRWAIGVSYAGQHYHGWQSQPDGLTLQDKLEAALHAFTGEGTPRIHTLCAGRTDTGVHGLQQVVHFDTALAREPMSWVRGTNRFLPTDMAVNWAVQVSDAFHARAAAVARRYRYVLLESPVRPSLEAGRVGWVFRPLDGDAMQAAAQVLLGTHDFTSFRAAQCQALSPVKTLTQAQVSRAGPYWVFDFEGNAFLHHMIRNVMGCLVSVGQGLKPADWMREVLAARSRDAAAPTFCADGLYFVGPVYAPEWGLPDAPPLLHWLPRPSHTFAAPSSV